MGFPVQTLAPKVTVQGRTFCFSAFEYGNVVGYFFTAGIYEQQVDGTWDRVISIVEQESGILELVKGKGGKVEFLKWLIAQVNKWFLDTFGEQPVPSGEPTTETEARAMIEASVLAMSFRLIDGVPVLQNGQ